MARGEVSAARMMTSAMPRFKVLVAVTSCQWSDKVHSICIDLPSLAPFFSWR